MRGIHWFRNDLRLEDNRSLALMLNRVEEWAAVFVLDPSLVEPSCVSEKRARFLEDCLRHLDTKLSEMQIPFIVLRGRPENEIPRLMHRYSVSLLSYNESVTPFGRRRDGKVKRTVEKHGRQILSARDDVIFSAEEIRSSKGTPYAVYTPYRNTWWRRFDEKGLSRHTRVDRRRSIPGVECPEWDGISPRDGTSGNVSLPLGGEREARCRLDRFLNEDVRFYGRDRDRPDLDATSRLSPYLRFGCISIRPVLPMRRPPSGLSRRFVMALRSGWMS